METNNKQQWGGLIDIGWDSAWELRVPLAFWYLWILVGTVLGNSGCRWLFGICGYASDNNV
jgi:hypothetical protein